MTVTPARRRALDRAVAAVIAVVAIAAAAVVYLTSQIRAADLVTGSAPPSAVAAAVLPTTLRVAWTTSTDPALGAVVSPAGTVVTTSPHGVDGLDAQTGKTIWSYTRSDRSLCRVAGLATKAGDPTAADAVQGRVDGIATVYAEGGYCSQVETFDAGTGARARGRTSPLPAGGSFVATGSVDAGGLYSGWLGPHLVEVWRDDLVRTLQYGDLPNPTQPGNAHLGCTFTDLAVNATQVATVEHCAATGSHAHVVLNVTDPGCGTCGYPKGWDQFKHSPRTDIDTGSDAAVLVGLTADRVAVLVATPQPAVVVYDAAGKIASRSPVGVPAAAINTAAATGAPLPARTTGDLRISLVDGNLVAVGSQSIETAAPATTLVTPTSSTDAVGGGSPFGSVAPGQAATQVTVANLVVRWTATALGLPAIRGDKALIPVPTGLQVGSTATGPGRGAAVIPIDRGGSTAQVDAAAAGSIIVETRGATVVALR